MSRLLFIMLLIGSAGTAFGQLSGVVWAGSGSPVSGATVHWEEGGRSTTTNPQGRFYFADYRPSVATLTVFAEGFSAETVRVAPGDPLPVTIRLSALRYDLSAVEVTDGSQQVLGADRLRNVEGTAIYAGKKSELIRLPDLPGNLAANNARELFKAVPGLNIWENDGSGLQLNIGARGLDPNRTANFNTRQNGFDISADALGYPESYYTPPSQALERIEIVRGAASLQYGTQFGGLLNFVIQQPPTDKPVEFLSENTAGSFGFVNTFTRLGGTTGPVSYLGFYQYKRGDGWRPNAAYDQHTGYADLHVDLGPRARIGLEYTLMRYLAQQPGGLTDFEFAADPRQSKRSRNWFRVNWNLVALHFDYRFSDRTVLNNRAFGLFAGRDALGELGPINRPDPMRERNLIVGKYRNFGNELRLLHRYRLLDQDHTFLIGARYYQGFSISRQGNANDGSGPDFEFLRPDDLEQADYEFPSRNVALFTENIFYLSPAWTLTPGIRFEYIKTASDGYFKERIFSGGEVIFEQRLEDRQRNDRSFLLLGLGTSYRFQPELELYANISQNYRAINFSDLAVVNPNLIIDSLLQDERGFNTDLGFRGRVARERIRFDVSLFYLRYNNRIGLTEIVLEDRFGLQRLATYRTNIGDARMYGLETYLEADLWRLIGGAERKPSLLAFVNMSLLDGRYLSGTPEVVGKQVEYVPPLSLRSGLTFRIKGLTADLQMSYVQRHFSDATNAEFVADATRGEIPSYYVLDASLRYEWKWLRFTAGVNNLTDNRYFTRRATAYPGPGIIPAEARRWYGGLRILLP